jgi:hypothetical protein
MSVTEELAALAAEHQRLVQHRRGIDQQERDAWQAVRAAEEELAALEREALAGDPPPQAQITAATKKLRHARENAQVEWAAKRKGADAAILAAEGDRQRYIHHHFEELLAEQPADEVAAQIESACHALLQAIRRRAAVEADVIALVHVAKPGDETFVRRSRTDAVRAGAERLVAQGEAPPKYEPLRTAIAIGEAL